MKCSMKKKQKFISLIIFERVNHNKNILRTFAFVMKRSVNELVRRYLSFVVVLFIIAFGTSLSIRANLGSSPISCPPYVLSLRSGGLTMGGYTFCMHIFFITAQILLLRRNFQKIQLLQIVVSVFFGFYTDLTMWMTSFLQVPATLSPMIGYPLRFIELMIGGGILAYGISLEVHCDVLMLAGEGFPLAIAKVTGKDFGRVKMCSDTALVVIGIIFMFSFFEVWRWDMVGVGTIFSMFYVGYMVRKFSPTMQWFDRILVGQVLQRQPVLSSINENIPFVITISREYGSGGHAVGEELAKRLNMDFYDHSIIDRTAVELGFSSEYVADKEQNISTAKIWELIFTDKSIPDSMNPSRDDAIFVAESRTIRELAAKGNCIIIGRMANWILRKRKNCVKVFITSSHETAIERIVAREHISSNEASRKIDRINKGRSNHYMQYSGQHWTDARSYDLVINISVTGINQAVSIIENFVSCIAQDNVGK